MTAPAATRTRLDRSAVVATALRLADAEGLEAVTVRRLAKELGVTPTALYWHVADKQALLDALVDQLWAEADAAVDHRVGPDPWKGLRQVLEALVAVFGSHPALAPLAPARILDCEPGLAITERSLELLSRAGFDAERAADAARFLLCVALMLVSSGPGTGFADEDERDRVMRQKRAALLTLPPGRYPSVSGSAEHLLGCDTTPGDYVRYGIDLVLAGLRTQARPEGRRRA